MKITEFQSNNPDLYATDKFGTTSKRTHAYGAYYDELFESKQNDKLNILEIGIQFGGSVRLFHDYFINSEIYAIDKGSRWIGPDIKTFSRLHTYKFDAYDVDNIINKLGVKFDIIIDDGPHTIESQLYFVNNMGVLLNDSGILILEDVYIKNLETITSEIRSEYHVFNWWKQSLIPDDILIEIKK